MECINLTRFFMAISLILIYVIQKLVGLAHQASPTNLKPKFDDMDIKHLSFEDQLQFIDQGDTIAPISFSVFSFELNERQGCLGTGNYTVMRTFLAINTGQMVMRVRGFRMGSSPTSLAHDYTTTSSATNNNNNNKATSSTTSADSAGERGGGGGGGGGGGASGTITTATNNNNNNNNTTTDTATAQHSFDQQRNLCHGYGFTIYDCEPFDLKPRHAHEIRIAFTPDFTLTNTIVSLTIFTNVSEGFKYALMATVPRDLLVACNHSLPRPEWETTMHYILAVGMVIMISCSIFMAYLEAKIYLKRERQSFQKRRDSSTSDKSLCSINNSQNGCSETNNNNISHVDNQSDCNSLDNNSHSQQVTISGQVSKKSNNRKGSVVNEKSSLNNHSNLSKSGASSNAERRTKSDFSNAPIFKNLTNVIASPPPPLPSFDCDFNEFDFKKSKSAKKSTKKSNSLSGSIAGNDDTSSNGSQTNGSNGRSGKNNKNNNCQSQKTHNGARDGKSSSNRSANQSPSLQQQSNGSDIVNKASESQQLTNNFNNFKSISSTNQASSKSSRSYSNGYSSSAINSVQAHNNPLSANGSKYWSNDMARFTGLVEMNHSSVSPAQNVKYVPTTVPTSCSSVLDNELDHLRATSSPWNSSLSAIDQMNNTPASVDRVAIASTKAPLRPCYEAFSRSDADHTHAISANGHSELAHDGDEVPKLLNFNSAFSVPSGLASSPSNSSNGPTMSSAPTDQFNLFGPDSGPNWIGWVNRQKT